jgi:hypothetical protein
LEVRSYSDVVGVLQRVTTVARIKNDNIVLIFVFSKVKLGIVISHHIEEDIVENDICKEDYSPVFLASPPGSETVERLFSLLEIVVIVGYRVSYRSSHGKFSIVLQFISGFKAKSVDSESLSVYGNIYGSVQ